MLGSWRYLIKTNLQHFGTVNKRKNIKKKMRKNITGKKNTPKISRLIRDWAKMCCRKHGKIFLISSFLLQRWVSSVTGGRQSEIFTLQGVFPLLSKTPHCGNWELGGSLGCSLPVDREGCKESQVFFPAHGRQQLVLYSNSSSVSTALFPHQSEGINHCNHPQVEKKCPWLQQLAHSSALSYAYDPFAYHLAIFPMNQTHRHLQRRLFFVFTLASNWRVRA